MRKLILVLALLPLPAFATQINQLPPVMAPASTDAFPVQQANGVTGYETPGQLFTGASVSISVLNFGRNAGNNDMAAAINTAETTAASVGIREVVVPNAGLPYMVGSPVILLPNVRLVCTGNAMIKLMPGANSNVLQSVDFVTQAANDENITISGCIVDGNSSAQTAGSNIDLLQNGIGIFGRGFSIQDVIVQNIYGNGIVLGAISGSLDNNAALNIENTSVYTTGHNGIWPQLGANDIHIENTQVIDAGQLADNTYCGIRMDVSGRLVDFHGWHKHTAVNRVAYQGCFYSVGVDVVASHFEGGRSEVLLAGGQDTISGSSEIYASFGAPGTPLVEITSNGNTIDNTRISGSTSYPGYAIDFNNGATLNKIGGFYDGFTTYAPFNFTNDGGSNYINATGFTYSGGATAFGGTYAATDFINYHQDGTVIDLNINPDFNPKSVFVSSVSLTTATPVSAASMSLVPGVWQLSCASRFVPTGTMTRATVGVSTTDATLPTDASGGTTDLNLPFWDGYTERISSPETWLTVTTPTTVYCVVQAVFSSGTETANALLTAVRNQ